MSKGFLTMALAGILSLGAVADEKTAEEVKFSADDAAPVLVVGDSMMRLLGQAMERELKSGYVQPVKAYSSLGSGLARIDAMDWFAKAQSLMDEVHPKVVVICMGANDKQTMQDGNGAVCVYGSDEWRKEYKSRVEKLLAIFETGGKGPDGTDKGGAKKIVWLLLPDMHDAAMQEYAMDVNAIISQVAAGHKEKVLVTDMRKMLSRRPGHYTPYMTDRSGNVLKVRDNDGVHLTMPGAKYVAAALVKTYWK